MTRTIYSFIVTCEAPEKLFEPNFDLEDWEAMMAWLKENPDVVEPQCLSFAPDWHCRDCEYVRTGAEWEIEIPIRSNHEINLSTDR